MKNSLQNLLIFVVALSIIFPYFIEGQVRTSTNYKIERDSINIGGGYSTSTSYQSQDTIGDVATGYSTSTSFELLAGYQQSLEQTYISISSPSDINMNSINGLTGGTSTSSAAWTVITNNNSGYSVAIKTTTNPALKSINDQFDDYSTSTADPDFNFSISATTAEFGYSPSGSHIVNRFRDDGINCNIISGGDSLYKCWDGLSTADETIASSASPNDPAGTVTTVHFEAESGNQKILTAGNYTANITLTAIAL